MKRGQWFMENMGVYILDDHSLFREGLKRILLEEGKGQYKVLGGASRGGEALEEIRTLKPDLVLVDVALPDLDGFQVCSLIKEALPDTKVVMLTMYGRDEFKEQARDVGASAYVVKDQDVSSMMKLLERVVGGEDFLSLKGRGRRSGYLSPREKEILKLIAQGYTGREIAGILNISVRTANTHRANIMRKLALKNTASMVRYAILSGLVVPGENESL
jgi:DNA-binding NarL/FixJ family response regulator